MRHKIILLVIAVFCLLPGKVHAASSNYEISTKYQLAAEGGASVEATLTAINTTDEATPQEVILPLVGNNPADISAKYDDGVVLETTQNQNSVTIKTTKDNSGSNKTWKIILSYKSDLAKKYGATTIFDVPAQKYDGLSIIKETVQMQSAAELGTAVARGPKPEVTSISLGEQMFTWTSTEGPLKQSVGMIFGESAAADFNLSTTLSNGSWWWKTLEVVLPPDTNQQKVALNSIEPQPTNIRLDEDGNIIAQYKIRPKGKVDVKALGTIYISNFSYALSGSSGLDNIPQALKDDYTSTNDTWSGNKLDTNIKTDQAVSQIIKDTYDAAVEQIPKDASGLEAAQEQANALVGELRSMGVPAKVILGKAYGDGVSKFDDPRPHAWVEAYAPATGWVTLDPMAERGSALYGQSDVERIGLVVRGLEPGYPPENLSDYSFSWREGEVEEPQAAQPTLKSVNNMILPGLAVRTVTLIMGPGTIVDDTALAVEGEGITKLGSLAPLEHSTTNMPALAGTAFASTKVAYGVLGQDELASTIAEVNTTISYVPMIVIIVAVIFTIIVIVLIKRLIRKRTGQTSKTNMVLNGDDSGMSIDSFDFDPNDVVDDDPPPELIDQEVLEEPGFENDLQPEPDENVQSAQQPEAESTQSEPKPRPSPIKYAHNVTMESELKPLHHKKRPPRLIQ